VWVLLGDRSLFIRRAGQGVGMVGFGGRVILNKLEPEGIAQKNLSFRVGVGLVEKNLGFKSFFV
jgi:hypothetical protein